MSKKIKINHLEPGQFRLDYILLPVGYSYNIEIASAKKGDIISLFDGGDYRVYAVKRLKIGNSAADILSRMRYGVTIKGVLSRWQRNARLEGHGTNAISTDECLWVIYDTDTEQI